MLKNYIKIAFRNIRRHSIYSFINIFGLAVGLASAIVIGSWVYQEWSYDSHFEHSDRIYRVGVNFYNLGDMAPGPERFSQSAEHLPEVEIAASLDHRGEVVVYVGDQQFEEPDAFAADTSYFDLFSYAFLEGDPATALDAPNSVVLTERLARKYFNGASAIGKSLQIGEEKTEYTVTGVVNEEATRSHIPARLWFRLDTQPRSTWTSASYYNYVLLKEGVTETQFKDQLNRLIEYEIYPSLKLNQPYKEWIQSDVAYRFIVMPLTDIYLKSELRFELTAGGNEANVNIFALVAIFIVLIAAVNFINITTARSANRAKEVGIRKTLGTGRPALIRQFMAESMLTSLLALLIAAGLAELFLVVFEQFTGMDLLESLYSGINQFGVILLLTLLIGGVAGLYPAFYLSRFEPVAVLKGQLSNSDNNFFRHSLVVVQFTISVALLACMGLIYQQLEFMQNTDLGLETENVLIIQNAGQLGDRQNAFRNALRKHSGIEQVSINSRVPTSNRVMVSTLRTTQMKDGLPLQTFMGDYDYLSVFGFQLKEGRGFLEDRSTDTAAVILNESAVRAMELKNPLNAQLLAGENEFRVIGVVNDFNYESLRNRVEPAAIFLVPGEGVRITAKINTPDVSSLLGSLQSLWSSFEIKEPMNYYFLDDSYARLMQKEKVLGGAVTLFAFLAVIISCLGLYGLSAYMCERRTKEIGIRKVLGARILHIVIHLNKNFTKPVILAILLAVPLSYMVMRAWLADFAFKIEIGPWVFVGACFAAMVIALLTVSWQSVRAALQNPAKSLRTE